MQTDPRDYPTESDAELASWLSPGGDFLQIGHDLLAATLSLDLTPTARLALLALLQRALGNRRPAYRASVTVSQNAARVRLSRARLAGLIGASRTATDAAVVALVRRGLVDLESPTGGHGPGAFVFTAEHLDRLLTPPTSSPSESEVLGQPPGIRDPGAAQTPRIRDPRESESETLESQEARPREAEPPIPNMGNMQPEYGMLPGGGQTASRESKGDVQDFAHAVADLRAAILDRAFEGVPGHAASGAHLANLQPYLERHFDDDATLALLAARGLEAPRDRTSRATPQSHEPLRLAPTLGERRASAPRHGQAAVPRAPGVAPSGRTSASPDTAGRDASRSVGAPDDPQERAA